MGLHGVAELCRREAVNSLSRATLDYNRLQIANNPDPVSLRSSGSDGFIHWG